MLFLPSRPSLFYHLILVSPCLAAAAHPTLSPVRSLVSFHLVHVDSHILCRPPGNCNILVGRLSAEASYTSELVGGIPTSTDRAASSGAVHTKCGRCSVPRPSRLECAGKQLQHAAPRQLLRAGRRLREGHVRALGQRLAGGRGGWDGVNRRQEGWRELLVQLWWTLHAPPMLMLRRCPSNFSSPPCPQPASPPRQC